MRYLPPAIVILLFLTACSSVDPPGGGGAIRGGAESLQAMPAYLAFEGSSYTTIDISADGSWTAQTDQDWLAVAPTSGDGDATVTIEVDRRGLAPDHYAGSILFRGAGAREGVTVYMRFPEVSGNLANTAGHIEPTKAVATIEPANASASHSDLLALPHVRGELLVGLDPYGVAAGEAIEGNPSGSDLSLQYVGTGAQPQAMREAAADLTATYGLRLVQQLAPMSSVFRVRTEEDLGSVIAKLERDGRVASAEPNYLLDHFGTPNDTFFGDQWHYDSINLTSAWDLTNGSDDVTVGVVDSSVEVSHPDLAAQIVEGYDFVTNSSSSLTVAHDHGTHVSGTIAASTDNAMGVAGVSWNAKIMPLNVFPDGGSASNADVYRAIVFAAGLCVNNSSGVQVCNDNPVDVINLSLGPLNESCAAMPQDSILEEAVAFALGQGVTIVAAAGNDNCDVVTVPAAIDGVLAVSATSIADSKASYSNYGNEIWVSAPGGDTGALIASTVTGSGYGLLAGTSMASPHVAGVAALLKAVNPELSPTQIAFVLAESAVDIGIVGPDTFYGYGLVDARSAVELAREMLTARFSDLRVRLLDGPDVISEALVGPSGGYTLEDVPAGDYVLEAGNDNNGNGRLGDAGEFFGSRPLSVTYTGDQRHSDITVNPR